MQSTIHPEIMHLRAPTAFSIFFLLCRGRVTVSESLNFDVINENANRGQLKGLDQMRLRDMTLMEFYTRVAGGWDPLYFAREFYLFSGRLPRWFQQGNFQDRQPLTCLKELSCPGCSELFSSLPPILPIGKEPMTVSSAVCMSVCSTMPYSNL